MPTRDFFKRLLLLRGILRYCFNSLSIGIYEDMSMRNFDFSPLCPTTIGFDHLSSLLNSIHSSDTNTTSYPPYNIELINENKYQITMAISGFQKDELSIQSEKQTLTVKGERSDQELNRKFLHKGIAARNFERRFQVADHVEIQNATLSNGLLHIDLVREIPEAMKPKSIPIKNENNRFVNVNTQNAA